MEAVCDLVMTEPSHFEVSYVINPWMQPARWATTSKRLKAEALLSWRQLRRHLGSIGVRVHLIEGVEDVPDLVFPANAAVVLNRRVLLARFAHPQRQREEPIFHQFFNQLLSRRLVCQIEQLPAGLYQEGAGDCLWDGCRQLFWCGFGQRSLREACGAIRDYFGCEVQPLELVDPRYYHLDVAMAVLEGGELMYHPEAFSPESLGIIRERVDPTMRIEVGRTEATRFNINAISAFGTIVMTTTSPELRGRLLARGYSLRELNLSPFLLAGGAAACLTLRLDHRSGVQDEEKYHGYVA